MRRLPTGGRIDRARPLEFVWNGERLRGFGGDTLASALLANGVSVLGPSVIRGRPRGIISAGAEEAHGFVQLGEGGGTEPLVRATQIELVDGLVATGGIRSTKGLLSLAPDEARFEKRSHHCDLLIIGGGPAGLAATRAAAGGGARVLLIDGEPTLGGSLLRDRKAIDGQEGTTWVEATEAALRRHPEVRIATRTTAAIALDQNGFILLERRGPESASSSRPERRLWQVRARQVILATGALERPIVFPDNDRPGVMLASAARAYLHRFALAPERAVIFTTNDDGYRTGRDLAAAGVPVTLVDPRSSSGLPTIAGLEQLAGWQVIGTEADGRGALAAVIVAPVDRTFAPRRIAGDLLAVAGGWDPALDLHHHRRGAVHWDERIGAIVPTEPLPGQRIAGAAAGLLSLGECLLSGHQAGLAAAAAVGRAGPALAPPVVADPREAPPAGWWWVPAPDGDESRSFVDGHRDATVAEIGRALGAGLRSVEHLKRYTLIGTGIEQGRSAKVNAAAVAAERLGGSFATLATSTGRPPVEPILFAAVAGRATGPRYEPARTTAIHPAHQALGAVLEPVGQWLRPRYFPRPGESLDEAVKRESRAARQSVAMMDASTLGKIDVQGPDAAEFLDRLYLNRIGTLKPGRARYGVMCRLDGSVFDDGVVMQLAPNRFFVTTSTSHAAAVAEWMEEWLQTEWRTLRVWTTVVTEQWTTIAVVGPQSRAVLAALAPDLPLDPASFPFLAVRGARVAGLAAQVARVSFSGELAFEVSVRWHHGLTLWNALQAAGAPWSITPYGLETLSVLRAEKGYLIVGQDTDTTTTPVDLGFGGMIAPEKDFIGKRSLGRIDLVRPDRRQLVGILPIDPAERVPEGAQLVADPGEPIPMTMLGHVTTSHWSEALGSHFGLALVAGGRARKGERLHAPLGDRVITVTVVDPVFYDPGGARRDG
jgi:sarcosine oxidase subunit alpha